MEDSVSNNPVITIPKRALMTGALLSAPVLPPVKSGSPTPQKKQALNSQDVKNIITELQPIFKKEFSHKKITYGPTVGESVKFEIVTDTDYSKAVKEEFKRLSETLENKVLKFAPEFVHKELTKYYSLVGDPFPVRLNTIDENTVLTREEKVSLFTAVRITMVANSEASAKSSDAFYSTTLRKIFFKMTPDLNANVIAHEMAHAYANTGWENLIDLMRLRGMDKPHILNEGMATYIGRRVSKIWYGNQTLPKQRYGSTYTLRAKYFIAKLGKPIVFEAYFGGWVDFVDNDKPEDSLIFGNKKKKKWRWPWR